MIPSDVMATNCARGISACLPGSLTPYSSSLGWRKLAVVARLMPDSPKLQDPRRSSIGEGSGPKKIGMGQRKAAQG